MRRQRVLRASSAQNLCIFCACRLGVNVAPSQVAPLISPAPRRNLNTRSAPLQQSAAAAAAPSHDYGAVNNEPPSFVYDPNSSLTRSEQIEKARRLDIVRQREASEQQEKRQREALEQQEKQQRIWEQEETRRKAAERDAARDSGRNARRDQPRTGGRQGYNGDRQTAEPFPFESASDRRIAGRSIGQAMASRGQTRGQTREQKREEYGENRLFRKFKIPDNNVFRKPGATSERTVQQASTRQGGPKKKALPSFLPSTDTTAPTSHASTASGWGDGGTETMSLEYGDVSEREPAVADMSGREEPRQGFSRDAQRPAPDPSAPKGTLTQFSFRPEYHEPEPAVTDVNVNPQETTPEANASISQSEAIIRPEHPFAESAAHRRPQSVPDVPSAVSEPASSSNLGTFGYYEEHEPVPQPEPSFSSPVSESSAIPGTEQSLSPQSSSTEQVTPRSDTQAASKRTPKPFNEHDDFLDNFEYVANDMEADDEPIQSMTFGVEPVQQSSKPLPQTQRVPQEQVTSGSDYRVTPFNPDEFEEEPNSQNVDHSANWEHLRRKTVEQPPPPPVPAQEPPPPPPQAATSYFDNEDWVDRKFEEHRQARQYQPPPPPVQTATERDHRPLSDSRETRTNRQCARCGEKGHVARECTNPNRMKCHACGGIGHAVRDCPTRKAGVRRPATQADKVYDDPFADESSPRVAHNQFRRPRADYQDPFSTPQVEQVVTRRRRDDFDESRQNGDARRVNPFAASEPESSRYNDRSLRRQQIRGEREDESYSAPAPSQAEIEESSRRQEARASRRSQKWADAEEGYDSTRSSKYGRDRKERRGGRRDFDDEHDEEVGAREEYRARKAARQAEEVAAKDAKQKAIRQRREAKKAAQTTPISLPEWTSVQQLSQLLGVRYEQFVERLEELGYDDIFPGKTLNSEISGMIAMEYNFEPTFDFEGREEDERDLRSQPEPEDKEFLPVRPPVVTIMGHVDHGKTTILDYLRKSSVAAGEAGGITQHIGAFSVPLASSGKTVTFLDTPGHAAFLAMRQRGANVTDIVILVVAADDSVKPQTLEALKHAKAAGVPMIVAINKIDKEGADIQRCKQDLARHGVEIEDFGGETQVVCVSGKTGQGMDELEENVVTLSEILDHRADTDGGVEGWVLEATTKKAGRVATVLVRRGTLKPGSVLVAGKTWTRVRTLRNEGGYAVREVGPGMPVEVDGWRDQPMAGDEVLQAESEQQATSVVDFRLEKEEREKIAQDTEAINETRRLEQEKREKEKAAELAAKRAASPGLDDEAVSSATGEESSEEQQSGQMTVPFIIKADVSGSAEAVSAYILSVSNPLIAPQILSSEVGAVHESDIDLAHAASGHIIAFNLPADPDMKALAEHRGVKILENNIIYRVLDDVKAVMEEKLPPIVTQRVLGEAEIAMEFEIGLGGRKKLKIAGCKVRNGVVSKGARVRVTRSGEKVYEGTITSLKNVKKDVQEMRKGTECGMGFDGWEGFEAGDQVQTFMEVEEKRKL